MTALLKELDTKTARDVLAVAALTSAPSPGVEDKSGLMQRYAEPAARVLAEIRSELRIGDSDFSVRAQNAINDYIAKQLDDYVLGGVSAKEVLYEIGLQGKLSPNHYELTYAQVFDDYFPRLGSKKQHVEAVVRRPDEFAHLMPELASDEERDHLSLFLKRFPGGDKAEPYWVLVQGVRKGLVIEVLYAWRIYPSDVDLSLARSPVDVLRAFANVFGRVVRIGQQEGKFLEAQSFRMNEQIEVALPTEGEFIASYSTRRPNEKLGIFQVGIAYCIDLDLYRAALRRHRVI